MKTELASPEGLLLAAGGVLSGVGIVAGAVSLLAPGVPPRDATGILLGGLGMVVLGALLFTLGLRMSREQQAAPPQPPHTNVYKVMRTNGVLLAIGGAVMALLGPGPVLERLLAGAVLLVPGVLAYSTAGRFEQWLRRADTKDEDATDDSERPRGT